MISAQDVLMNVVAIFHWSFVREPGRNGRKWRVERMEKLLEV